MTCNDDKELDRAGAMSHAALDHAEGRTLLWSETELEGDRLPNCGYTEEG